MIVPLRFFCAVCVGDIASPTPRQAPLGKGGALVNICESCAGNVRQNPPREPRPAYDAPDPAERAADMKRAIAMAAAVPARNRIVRTGGSRNEPVRDATPSWITVRVSRWDERGRARDAREAASTLAGEPWIAELRYRGMDARCALFERPPRVIIGGHAIGSSSDYPPSCNPIAWLEPYRVESAQEPTRANDEETRRTASARDRGVPGAAHADRRRVIAARARVKARRAGRG